LIRSTKTKVALIDNTNQLAKAHIEIEEHDWELNLERE